MKPLRKGEGFEERQVPVVATGATDFVVSEVSPRTGSWGRKNGGVEPFRNCMRGWDPPGYIGPVTRLLNDAAGARTTQDKVNGRSALHVYDARHLPSANR